MIVVGICFTLRKDSPSHDKSGRTRVESQDRRQGSKIKFTDVEPKFITYKAKNNRVKENSYYADVINHSNNPHLSHDRDTNAHETTHLINSDIRNGVSGPKTNAFYIGDDKAVVVKEPKIRKSRAIEFIPQNLRAYRFETYVSGQQAWDDTPTYIFDEWVAYINGGSVSVDDAESGKKHEWTDAVLPSIEFSIYAVGVAMAVEKHDREYWDSNPQFKTFVAWHLKRSHDLWLRGKKHFPWDKQDQLVANLRNDPSAKAMRSFIKKHFNGVWLDGETAFEYGTIDWSQYQGATNVVRRDGKEIKIMFDKSHSKR